MSGAPQKGQIVRAESDAQNGSRAASSAGMTILELVIGMAVVCVLVGIVLPFAKNIRAAYNLSAAVAAVSGSIQNTRYHAIEVGCPYAIAFSPANTSYQVSYEALSGTPPTCAATFANLGGPIPWATSNGISVNAATTLQFSPNGSVAATTGSLVFSLTNGMQTETITVSGVGNVSVNP